MWFMKHQGGFDALLVFRLIFLFSAATLRLRQMKVVARRYKEVNSERYPQTMNFTVSLINRLILCIFHSKNLIYPLLLTPLLPFLLLPLTSLPSSIANKASLFLSPTTFNASLTTLLSTLTPSSTYSSICLPTLSSIA